MHTLNLYNSIWCGYLHLQTRKLKEASRKFNIFSKATWLRNGKEETWTQVQMAPKATHLMLVPKKNIITLKDTRKLISWYPKMAVWGGGTVQGSLFENGLWIRNILSTAWQLPATAAVASSVAILQLPKHFLCLSAPSNTDHLCLLNRRGVE